MAAEQVEAVQLDGPGVAEVVGDKGYHSSIGPGCRGRMNAGVRN